LACRPSQGLGIFRYGGGKLGQGEKLGGIFFSQFSQKTMSTGNQVRKQEEFFGNVYMKLRIKYGKNYINMPAFLFKINLAYGSLQSLDFAKILYLKGTFLQYQGHRGRQNC
jgi:hypothetical protein